MTVTMMVMMTMVMINTVSLSRKMAVVYLARDEAVSGGRHARATVALDGGAQETHLAQLTHDLDVELQQVAQKIENMNIKP